LLSIYCLLYFVTASEQCVQGLSTCPAKQEEKGVQTAYARICNGISDSLSFPVGVNFTLFDSSGICYQKNKDNNKARVSPCIIKQSAPHCKRFKMKQTDEFPGIRRKSVSNTKGGRRLSTNKKTLKMDCE